MRSFGLFAALLLGCDARAPAESNAEPGAASKADGLTTRAELPTTSQLAPPVLEWANAPMDPTTIGPGIRPRVVLLSAPWCQWCRVFEHDVLPRPELRAAIGTNFDTLAVDTDASPLWMDLPGVEGLPSLVFFDAGGRHLLSRSGYRDAVDLVVLVDAIADGLRKGTLEPYPDPPAPRSLANTTPMDGDRARAELTRLERDLYLRVNSNDGGFGTPSRHPHPALLLELQRWTGRTDRAEAWIAQTLEHALRGHSPRLDGDPLAGMDLGAVDLIGFSAGGPELEGWRSAVERLPNLDPYRGLQDPVDHGVYRYCAGPGWYHPHFERRASDNLAWALLLRERGREAEALEIYAFVEATFGRESWLDTSQRSDPFHARLRAGERVGVVVPRVAPLRVLDVQALAARFDSARCSALEQIPADAWPRMPGTTELATVDAVGELLVALAHCPGRAPALAAALAQTMLERWRSPGLRSEARLVRLAAGICEALPDRCAEALAGVEGLEVNLDFPPPLGALARIADAKE